jgi:hypothetical protein
MTDLTSAGTRTNLTEVFSRVFISLSTLMTWCHFDISHGHLPSVLFPNHHSFTKHHTIQHIIAKYIIKKNSMSQKAHTEQVGLELTLYIRILRVLGSTLGQVPGYHDWGFSWLSWGLQSKYWCSTAVRPRPHSSKSFQIHLSFYLPTLFTLNSE